MRRRAAGLQESTRTPGTAVAGRGAKRVASGSTKMPAAPQLGKKSAGGGGAGVEKPRRSDRERQRLLRMEPAQRDAVEAAVAAYADPSRRLIACRALRTGNEYDETLPLSPPARPCATPECRCSISYSTLANMLGLGSPSVVRASLPVPLCPSRVRGVLASLAASRCALFDARALTARASHPVCAGDRPQVLAQRGGPGGQGQARCGSGRGQGGQGVRQGRQAGCRRSERARAGRGRPCRRRAARRGAVAVRLDLVRLELVGLRVGVAARHARARLAERVGRERPQLPRSHLHGYYRMSACTAYADQRRRAPRGQVSPPPHPYTTVPAFSSIHPTG